MATINYPVFEVFIQKSHSDNHIHAGNLIAPNKESALLMARENFARRDSAINIWVVPRQYIISSSEDKFLKRELDHKYREVTDYTENGRLWRLFKDKSITLDEIIQYVNAETPCD